MSRSEAVKAVCVDMVTSSWLPAVKGDLVKVRASCSALRGV